MFCRFFEQQLFPFIEHTNAMSGDDRGVVGFSLGALWASYVLAQCRHMFRRYVAISPPVEYAGTQIYAGLEQQTDSHDRCRGVYGD